MSNLTIREKPDNALATVYANVLEIADNSGVDWSRVTDFEVVASDQVSYMVGDTLVNAFTRDETVFRVLLFVRAPEAKV